MNNLSAAFNKKSVRTAFLVGGIAIGTAGLLGTAFQIYERGPSAIGSLFGSMYLLGLSAYGLRADRRGPRDGAPPPSP